MNFFIPEALLPLMDLAVRKLDTDRSKFTRAAIREKMERAGVSIPNEGH